MAGTFGEITNDVDIIQKGTHTHYIDVHMNSVDHDRTTRRLWL